MLLSIIIPSRNEPYLHKTINDLLKKASGPIEIIAVLDGYWPPAEEIISDDRVIYLHFEEPRGMRNAINAGVAIAKGENIMKTDAHCLFDQGYDTKLTPQADNIVIVPRRKRLDPEKWEIINDGRPPVDYEYLAFPNTERGLYGIRWEEKAKERQAKDLYCDSIISAQGSCWVMKKSYYEYLELLDEKNFGKFYLEFQEISLKAWLSGGSVVVDKRVSYCHWHKTKGRGYALSDDRSIAVKHINEWIKGMNWHKQTKSFEWLINNFLPMPGWGPDWKEQLQKI
jgi:glycosyltransferase involved in cell wall biosynthesis